MDETQNEPVVEAESTPGDAVVSPRIVLKVHGGLGSVGAQPHNHHNGLGGVLVPKEKRRRIPFNKKK